MEFRKKLKTRLYLAISYIILGVLMIAGSFVVKNHEKYIFSCGFAWAAIGVMRIIDYLRITKSEASIRNREIAETDERNIAIVHRARSVTFTVYVMALCVAVIVLSLLEMKAAMWISYSMFALIAIYWITYFIVRKRY